jgi:hypothetical protein
MNPPKRPSDRNDEAGTAGDPDPTERHLDEEEDQSFPASDPHSDWAGPPGAGGGGNR